MLAWRSPLKNDVLVTVYAGIFGVSFSFMAAQMASWPDGNGAR